MKYKCPKCDTNFEEDANFCPNCGFKFTETDDKIKIEDYSEQTGETNTQEINKYDDFDEIAKQSKLKEKRKNNKNAKKLVLYNLLAHASFIIFLVLLTFLKFFTNASSESLYESYNFSLFEYVKLLINYFLNKEYEFSSSFFYYIYFYIFHAAIILIIIVDFIISFVAICKDLHGLYEIKNNTANVNEMAYKNDNITYLNMKFGSSKNVTFNGIMLIIMFAFMYLYAKFIPYSSAMSFFDGVNKLVILVLIPLIISFVFNSLCKSCKKKIKKA